MRTLQRYIRWCLLSAAAALAGGPAWADQIVGQGMTYRGWIIRAGGDELLILQRDGRAIHIEADAVAASFDFPPEGRLAFLTREGQSGELVRLTGFMNGTLRGHDGQGKPIRIATDGDDDVVIYPVPEHRKVLPLPYVEQKPDYCAEACIEMLTTFLGRPVSQDQANETAHLNGSRGIMAGELEEVVAALGLRTQGLVWRRLAGSEDAALADRIRLIQALARSHPVLIGIWDDPDHKVNVAEWPFDHFVLAVGYDLDRGEMILHDPARRALRRVSFDEFARIRQNQLERAYQLEFRLFRHWQEKGGASYDAELVGWKGGKARLRPEHGSDILVAANNLSPADQAFLRQLGPIVEERPRSEELLPPGAPIPPPPPGAAGAPRLSRPPAERG